mgnify:CR=1 FL=1
MKKLLNLLGIVLMSVSIVSCGGEENNKSTKPSINQDPKLENEKESVEKIKPKCTSDAKEFQINNNIISSITLSKIECQENYHLDSEIRDLLNKGNQITFLKNQENQVSGETEGYNYIDYKENLEFYGILVVSLDSEEFSIEIRGSKKK